jgi:hypothetical protein
VNRRFSADEMNEQRAALAEHQADQHPMNNIVSSATVCDYTKHPKQWLAPALNLESARAARHAEISAAQANAKPAPPQPTVEEQHQELVERRRASGGVQKFNRQSFK